uniref:SH3 domain-containing protein n=1 Tax=Rhabditophanes sp. KR3021 TaxID=114890 RepID=A0AC35U6Q1_9BILA
MVNIPPPPPIPSKSPIPGIRHWNIPTEPSVSNIGKAEGIVEIPEKQSVSNLRTQITNKLLMKTPTGAVVQEPVKVQTKSLLNEQFKSNLDDYSDNHLSNKEGIRSRSLTPMSFYHNGPLAKNSSTSRVSINNVGISDDSDGVSTLRRMRSELTTPSFQRATLCNSTYELNDDSNDKSELTNGDSNLKIFTPYQKLLQNSNQILSRGINDLKKNQFNEIIQKTKGEKLSEELSTQQSRRHGYIPSSTPSLQNNFDRFDGLIKNFDNTPMSRQSPFPEYKTAIALFKFNGKNVRELSLNKGDVVKVHREIDGNWIEGERNGKFGMFPACYVQFFGRNKNELSLKAGEVIKKTRDIDSNWIEGVNQHGEIGIFPSNYVKPYHDSEQKSGMSSMPSYSMTSVNATNSVCGPPSESTYGGFERSGSVAPERPKTPKFMANLTSQPQPQFAQMSQNGSGEPSRVISPLQPKRQPNRLPEIQQWQQRHHSEGLSGPANLVPRNSEMYVYQMFPH